MRSLAAAAILLLAIVPTGAPLHAEEAPSDRAGVYGLDPDAYRRALAVKWRKTLDTRAATLPKEQAEIMRASLDKNAAKKAQEDHVLLDLEEDGSFRALRQTLTSVGPPRQAECTGTWKADGETILLTVSGRGTGGAHAWLPEGVVAAACTEAGLTLPDQESPWTVPFPLRRLPGDLSTLVRATPSERGRIVRDGLGVPDEEHAIAFHGEMWVLGDGAARVGGSLRILARPSAFEQRPAWEVTVTQVEWSVGEERVRRAWLAQDLRLLRLESHRPASGVPRRGGEDPLEPRLVTRTRTGYRIESSDGDSTFEPIDVHTTEVPIATVGALLLFLRACPDLPLTYELPVLGREELEVAKVEVHGLAPGFRGPDVERSPAGWMARIDGTRVEFTPETRRPVSLFGGGIYGAFLLAEPGLVSAYDLSGISVPCSSPEDAAWAFALATIRGDRDVLEQVLEFEPLRAQAEALGLSARGRAFRAELLEKLERRRQDLLPGEKEAIASMLARRRKIEPEGSGMRVKLPPPCQDFEVVATSGPDGWRVTALLPSMYEETLCCGSEWTDPDHPEPVVGGCRLWLWRRQLRNPSRESVGAAADALARMGESGIRILVSELCREDDGEDGVDSSASIVWALGSLGMAVLPHLLEAHARAEGPCRARLDAVAEGLHVGSRSGTTATDPDEDLPVLLQALATDWPALRPFVVRALADIGPSAAEAIPALEALQAEGDRRLAMDLRSALGSLRKQEVRIPVASTPEEIDADPGAHPLAGDRRWSVSLFPSSGARQRKTRLTCRAGPPGWVRAVGRFKVGTYTLVVQTPGWAPVIVRDVELSDGVTTLDPIHVRAGSSVTVRLTAREGLDATSVRATLRWTGAPPYQVTERPKRESPDRILLEGVARGTYQLTVSARGVREPLLDTEIEVDGETDIDVDL